MEEQVYQRRKENILGRVRRLAPGAASSVKAIRLPDGSIRTDIAGIAEELKRHWSQVFAAKPFDGQAVQT